MRRRSRNSFPLTEPLKCLWVKKLPLISPWKRTSMGERTSAWKTKTTRMSLVACTRLTFASNRLCYYLLYSPSLSTSFPVPSEVLSERERASCLLVSFRVPHTRDFSRDLLKGRACLEAIISMRIHGPMYIF